jgi:metal-responsive CopG/Arc/MetJ family transcriptional regulator
MMGYSKMSVTIPEEIYKEVKEVASRKKIKLSHLVADALAEKTRKIKEETFVEQINRAFENPEVAAEQKRMAETIAENAPAEELPW